MLTYVQADKVPVKNTGLIKLYDEKGFVGMRKAGKLVATCLDEVSKIISPGISTQNIDDFVSEFCKRYNVIPATLNYRGYPKSCCTSINHVVCHGIPNDKPMREGDILNVDVTLIVDGWHGDSSRMYTVGKPKRIAERLIDITYDTMMRGIEQVKPNNKIGAIGHAIESFAKSNRCSVVRDFCGHGIGLLFHDAPNILNYGNPDEGVVMCPGMIFTVEPMVNLGRPHVKLLNDGWSAVTRDRSLSAQFEHTVGVTKNGYEIFTLSPNGYTKPPYL